jgi:tRNA A-37 threonylcarbamoyl transferase component Bud32
MVPNTRIKYRIISNNDIEDFVLNIRENFKADVKVLYNQRNVIKLFKVNGKKYVVKSFKIPHLFNRIIYSFFRKSKAERSYINTKKLESLNIGTPSPVAYIEFYSSFLIKESFYISEYFDFDYQMSDALYDETFNDRNSVFRQFAKFTYEIHNKGVFHSDYNHGNILFKNNKGVYEFSLVDVNRMKFMTLNYNLRMKSMCRLTKDIDTLKLIIKDYCIVSGENFDHQMSLLTKYLEKFNQNQENKKILKKILRKK